MKNLKKVFKYALLSFALVVFSGCADNLYYAGMEKVGFHKRDIMVDRIENVQDSQKDTQEEFKSALEQFGALVNIENTDLKQAYDKFNGEYEDASSAAESLDENIDSLENVSLALFEEWEDELNLYTNTKLKEQSRKKLLDTKANYEKMIKAMRASYKSIEPILATFQDNVLMLKHSLNAQAIGSLRGEFNTLKNDINILVENMNKSINESNLFIKQME